MIKDWCKSHPLSKKHISLSYSRERQKIYNWLKIQTKKKKQTIYNTTPIHKDWGTSWKRRGEEVCKSRGE